MHPLVQCYPFPVDRARSDQGFGGGTSALTHEAVALVMLSAVGDSGQDPWRESTCRSSATRGVMNEEPRHLCAAAILPTQVVHVLPRLPAGSPCGAAPMPCHHAVCKIANRYQIL